MAEKAGALRLTLHDSLVGYITGYQNKRNVLTLAPDFIADRSRPALTLSMADEDNFQTLHQSLFPRSTRMRVHPLLSNLLPEGALRQLMSSSLKIHEEDEFPLLARLGSDLPGALQATPEAAQSVPDYAFGDWGRQDRIAMDILPRKPYFSLAGVQMKFSMSGRDGRYIMSDANTSGDWIIKTPSTLHPFVPLNEYTSMHLAGLIGVEIPEIRLIELSDLERIPAINLPEERYAYGIRRFDRSDNGRVHTEDFAQITFSYPQSKYERHSYRDIGESLYRYGACGQQDVVQMAIRLLTNILLANGDAHKKNWSIHYPDRLSPRLAPAYDILSTRAYIDDEQEFALSLGGTKRWYDVTLEHFMQWADGVGVNRSLIKLNLQHAMGAARTLWPEALAESPMIESQQAILRQHWRNLQADFRIDA